jgi:non-ribosomal peptide synthetase-like protein
VSIKDIYQYPTIRSLAAALVDTAPMPVERVFADVLADVVDVDRVSVDSHFFDDLGADSMVMARFCARVRKRPDLPAVSIKDIYQYPTIRSLATALSDAAPVPEESLAPTSVEDAKPPKTAQFILCGVLQLLIFVGYAYLAALVIAQGYNWISAGSGVLDIYLRSLLASCALFLFLFAIPILAKWILIGRWKPRQIRIWSLAYVRFWVVKTLVRRNPIVLFTGSPLFNLYLRALGAKIGRGVVILSNHVPICTDLVTIGDGTVIRKDSFINGYRAHAGFIQMGSITIGKNAVISEAAVIDIDTSMGDGTQLGHASSLHSGQTVPDGQHWHGPQGSKPWRQLPDGRSGSCGTVRRVAYAVWQLLTLLLVYLPVGFGAGIWLLVKVPELSGVMGEGKVPTAMVVLPRRPRGVLCDCTSARCSLGFLIVTTVPRLLNLLIRPDKVYRLYGFHYGIHRWIVRLTNVKVLSNLVGDSSWIVHYLRGIGYDLGKIVQTGANFGGNVKHGAPYLSSIGSGTMVRVTRLSMMNAESRPPPSAVPDVHRSTQLPSATASPIRREARQGITACSRPRSWVPISGKVRENVGLLGSPASSSRVRLIATASFDP